MDLKYIITLGLAVTTITLGGVVTTSSNVSFDNFSTATTVTEG